ETNFNYFGTIGRYECSSTKYTGICQAIAK
ncbi:hypothetical protein, partial [uncultured Gammaproteobacteria bacterium]